MFCLVCTCSDYGFERSHIEGKRCFADFWHDPDSPPEDCHLGQAYESSTGSVHVHKHSLAISSVNQCLCANYGAGIRMQLALA